MENVPYAFIESVLTCLTKEDLDAIRANLHAPLWTSAAENHLRKRDHVTLNLAVKKNGTLFFFCTHAKGDISIDELLQLDVRFARIYEFDVASYESNDFNASDMVEMPAERLTDLMRFVSHVPVLSCSILVKNPTFLKRLGEELAMNTITIRCLALQHFPEMEGFLKGQLENQNLEDFTLIELNCPKERRAELEAFACSANFGSLTVSGETPQFDFPSLIRIIDAWKRQPEKRTAIAVPTSKNLADEFGALLMMTRDWKDWFLELTDDYMLEVECCDTYVKMYFVPQ